jgi:acetyl esterase/lipase
MTDFKVQKVVRLYEGRAPGSEAQTHEEQERYDDVWDTRIVYNVVDPTLAVCLPDPRRSNGTALVICPGGGFHALSIDREGLEVARWFVGRGVACFVLQYRLVECRTADPVGELAGKSMERMAVDCEPVIRLAMVDGMASIQHVREHAEEYGVRVDRVGMIGFSAGGTVATSVAFRAPPLSRPDFVAPIYLQYDWAMRSEVPPRPPPMFILAATDDELGLAPHSLALYRDWTSAGGSAELHLFAAGGHGFGMGRQGLPSDRWIERLAEWMEAKRLLTTS